ncbi:MAG: hypothetical protein ABW054_09105, partial [Casimicrobiaceae bacterium]
EGGTMTLPAAFVLSSAAIIFALGAIHLLYTFSGRKLTPRDPALQTAMAQVSPVLTRQTTMWKAWIGFNASHSMGALLFGLVYGWFALVSPAQLFASWFLLAVGFAMLAGLAALGRAYWFSVPFRCICVAFACYLGAFFASRLG